MTDADQPMETAEGPEVAETAAEAPAEQPAAAEHETKENEQPAAEPAAEKEEAKVEEKSEEKPMEKSPERVKERERSRERSRSRDRRRDRDGDKDFRARSRSRSRDRRRRSRSRSRDRRRSRSRSRSPYDKSRSSHRSRRSRFEDDNDSDREERRKRSAAAAAAAAPPSGAFPGPPGSALAANPALAGMDPATAQLVMRQQMLLQQQLLMAQQQAAVLQAQQVMSKATKAQTGNARQQEKQLKAQRELFVGNLAPGVGEQSLYQVFHSALIAAFPQAGQPGQEPVLKVALNGRFAFVEFRVPEYATAALQLNGQIALMGNTLKIARPASYVEPAMLGGGLAGLGGMPGQPAAYPGPPAAFGGPASAGASAAAVAGPGGVTDPMALLIPTPFLCVTGMVTPDVLANDEEYKEVIADLHQESSKYGTVLDVKVPRPPHGQAAQLMGTEHYGKAFVQFADVPSAQKAKDAIHGRMFAGNIVQAFYVSLHSFQSIPASVTH